MTENELKSLLDAVAQGAVTPADAARNLQIAPSQAALNGVNVDHHRAMRTGLGEAVLALGKSDDRLVTAVRCLHSAGTPVLVTRVSESQGKLLSATFPHGELWPDAGLFSLGKQLHLEPPYSPPSENAVSAEHSANTDSGEKTDVLVLTAGAADMQVALEALGTLRFYNINARLISDVGVAGLHRITPHLETLHTAKLHIVVAGMEGALPSVIAGLCGRPVVAVPTSVGYGAGAGGMAPLLAMLNSCAAGISVTNIDNGYGAAVFAAKLVNTFCGENA